MSNCEINMQVSAALLELTIIQELYREILETYLDLVPEESLSKIEETIEEANVLSVSMAGRLGLISNEAITRMSNDPNKEYNENELKLHNEIAELINRL